ncbi:ribosomal large subunit pseudouridine synthase D [Lentibacillus halodurans]|uniref:Pseudouridine synthase n=1 Tax=Lentibacillus halodurans TaxID=237679 RepID=A0A1I0Z0U2_9BACI|nr:RluA family pseudouridine synthase [Lentibacillus halodurans]SFB19245.1 ribosomal large subunit pseudouridine synthase D [Lentibacillus halodurans]
MTKQHTVTETEQNIRIDKLLSDMINDVSRSQIQSWIADDYVSVNAQRVKANYKCQTGDVIEWILPEPESLTIEPENIPLSIVYEDSDLLVVNKPRGMVVHPSAGHQKGTLVNALMYHCDSLSHVNGGERPGIVHRIDKDTSGLLVVAKNDPVHISLAEQLSAKDIDRQYEAIVHGVIDHETGLIDAPIGRDPNDRKKMGVVDNGKSAVTHFRVVNRFADFTHVVCQLETGRTHQIRVHMKYIGFPIAGDPKYGQRKTLDIGGQALHAKSLEFKHPSTNEQLHFEVEAPCYFQGLLAQFEKSN